MFGFLILLRARRGRPAGLLASDSGTGPRIEPNHTQADLFTTVPLPHPDRHALFPLSWRREWLECLELLRRRPAAAAAAAVRCPPLQLPPLSSARRQQRPPKQQSLCV